MANKNFIVRNGLAVGNTLVVNTTSNTVSVVGTVHANTVIVSGSAIPSGAASNLAFNTTNAAFGVANAAYNNANVGLASANSWANQIGLSSNSWANTVALSANGWANTVGLSANGWANTVALSANGWANTVALSANGWANTVAISANSWANSVALSANSWANTVALSANGWANTVGTSGNAYAVVIGASSNTYANNTFLKLTGGTIGGDLSVTGNLNIIGNTTYVNVSNYKVEDSLIYVADKNYTSDLIEIGFVGNYNNGACTTVHTGLFRSPSTKEYYLFQGYDKEPSGNYIDPTGNNITNAVLNADLITSNLTLGGANSIVWIKAGYDNSNGAFGVANAAFGHSNITYGAVNSAFGVVNSAYGLANTDSTRLSAAYVVANAAFGVANNALPKAGGTMTGKPTISIDDASMAVAGSHLTINSPTLSQASLGFTFGGVGKASLRIDNGGSYVMNSMANTYYFGYDVASGGTTTSNFYNSSSQFMYVSGANVYFPTDVRSPIFYDKDDTGYYVNPASTSNLNGLNIGGFPAWKYSTTYTTSTDWNTILPAAYSIRLDEIQNGTGWTNGPSSAYAYGGLFSWAAANHALQLYVPHTASGSNNGMWYRTAWNPGTTWSNGYAWARILDSANYSSYCNFGTNNVYGAIYYDGNDTGYYCNPNGISSLWSVNIRGDADSTNYQNQIHFWGSSSTTTSAIGFKSNGGYFTNPTGNGDGYNTYFTMDTDGRGWVFRRGTGGNDFSAAYTSGWILNNGVWQAQASMRAPIFYDSNDTAYYVNPNDVSYMVEPRMAWRSLVGEQNYDTTLFDGGYSYRPGIVIRGNYPHIDLISSNINNSYHGPTLRFTAYDTASASSGNFKHWVMGTSGTNAIRFSIGYASNNTNPHEGVYGYGTSAMWFENDSNVYCNASIRPTIMYDRNDTTYYCDPNSTSYMVGMTLVGDMAIRNGSPTFYFKDTDQQCATLHNNSNLFYILRHNSADVGWTTVGSGWWPMTVNLTNNDVSWGGNITAAYNVTAYGSDGRLKTNVKEIPNAIEKIKAIRGVTFDWNDTADEVGFKPERKYDDIGCIAQEVQAIMPQVVHLAPFDRWKPDPDTDYTDEELAEKMDTSRSGENYLTIQYDRMVPLLIQAIKEQQDKIDRMESLINQLLNK